MENFFIIITLLLIILVWNFGYKKYFLDKFRHDLFSLRFKLLKLGFEDKSIYKKENYVKFESHINDVIRYAHRISILSILLSNLILKIIIFIKFGRNKKLVKSPNSIEIIESNLKLENDEKYREGLNNLLKEFKRTVFKYVFFSSFVFFVFFVLQIIFMTVLILIINIPNLLKISIKSVIKRPLNEKEGKIASLYLTSISNNYKNFNTPNFI